MKERSQIAFKIAGKRIFIPSSLQFGDIPRQLICLAVEFQRQCRAALERIWVYILPRDEAGRPTQFAFLFGGGQMAYLYIKKTSLGYALITA